MDEVNFNRAGIRDIEISKNHMKQLYNTAYARITGTFKLNGKIYGKMFTCSSKNTDNDYLSEHIEQQLDAGNNHLFLFDKPQWEVLPSYRFGKEKFYITVGDRFKRGFVVPDENSDEQHLQEYRNEGYKVLEVPSDYKPNFKADYDIALRDIAGISVVGAMGFITQEMITPNVSDNRVNPFFEDYYEIGLRDNDTLERHFHPEVVPANLKQLPMNIHIDFAETSDHIGISGVVIDGTKTILDLVTNKKIILPYFRQIFQVAIGAPHGDRMSFQKVINFIISLRNMKFNVGVISTDQYQSSYVRENLSQQGFEVEKISVDKSPDPYISLRNLLQDQRIELVKCDLQEIELINLQRNGDRVDHRPQSAGSSGSTPCLANGYNTKGIGKDCSDALTGACATLIAHYDSVRPPAKSVLNAINSVNTGRSTRRTLGGTLPGSNSFRQNIPGFGSQHRRF
jgi:RNase P/RNase MRP subunit p29